MIAIPETEQKGGKSAAIAILENFQGGMFMETNDGNRSIIITSKDKHLPSSVKSAVDTLIALGDYKMNCSVSPNTQRYGDVVTVSTTQYRDAVELERFIIDLAQNGLSFRGLPEIAQRHGIVTGGRSTV